VGIFGKTTLLSWLNTYTFPMEARLKDSTVARRVYTACIRKMLAHGTTAAAYYATRFVKSTNLLADLCLEMGQRGLIGRVCMDEARMCPEYYRDETPEESVALTRDVIEYVKKRDPTYDLIRPIITPRFAPACSSAALRGLGDLQKETGLPVQTHISENEGEIRLVGELFPDAPHYTGVYDMHGLLTDKTILAHAIHLSEAEAEMISDRGAKISHCPCSNSSITSGTARVRWLWEKGIDIGLGTDMAGGYSPSVLEAARQASLVSRHVAMRIPPGDEKERTKLTVEEVLFLATRGGAKVVGLEERVGAFTVGREFDALLIGLNEVDGDGFEVGMKGAGGWEEVGNVDVFGWETWEEKVAKWVFGGDDRCVRSVWIQGVMVHERR